MPIKTALWKIDRSPPIQLPESTLESEHMLEEMIVADPRLLSDDWMIYWSASRHGAWRHHRYLGNRP